MDNVEVMQQVPDQVGQVQDHVYVEIPDRMERVTVSREYGLDKKATVLRLVDDFSGQGDVSEWLEKVEIVCRLHGINSEADMLYVVMLRVSGEAYRVLQQMSPQDKLSMHAVKYRLKEAYEANMFDAYELFKARTWRKGESIDGYASALARLAELSGGATSKLLVAAFVSGLPANARNVIRSTTRPGELRWSDAVSRARQIVNQMTMENTEKCLAMEGQDERGTNRPVQWQRKGPWCRRCKKVGHRWTECPDVECYACHAKGHIARTCSGNEGGGQA